MNVVASHITSLRRWLSGPGLILLIFTLWSSLAGAQIPVSYDLRDHGWITPTLHQGSLGTCWAFATTTAFKSSLLRQGVVDDPLSPELDLSIWHMAAHSGYHPDFEPPYNNWGGLPNFAMAYWTRGSGEWLTGPSPAAGGPVFTSNDPLNVYPIDAVKNEENLFPYVPPAIQPAAYRLESSWFTEFTGSGAPTADPAFRAMTQQRILDYGGVASGMFFDNAAYDSSNQTYFYDGTPLTPNHAVVLAGWDDNKTVTGASSPGAWLVQNSWGDDWGDDGYFWISYEDTVHAIDLVSWVAGEKGLFTDHVLQNQIYYPDTFLGPDAGEVSLAASRLTSEVPAIVGAFGIYTKHEGMTVTLNLYSDWQDGPVNLLDEYSLTLTLENSGYSTLNLPEELVMSSLDTYYVVLDYGDGFDEVFPLDTSTFMEPGEELSWIWDGEEWIDLASSDLPSVLFLKGLTVIPEPGTLLLAIAGLLTLSVVRRRS